MIGRAFGSIAFALACGAAASAAETGRLSFSGFVELEQVGGAIDDTLLSADLRASLTTDSGLGFDAGLVGLTDFQDSEHALYAALTYSFGNAKLSIGVPRPAYDSFGQFPALAGIEALTPVLAPLHGGVAENAYLLGDSDAPLGLRYDGSYGRLRVAASLHRFDDLDANAQALALRFEATSNIAVLADWERFSPAGPDITTGRLGTELGYGPLTSGLAYFRRDFGGAGPEIDGTETWVSYAPTAEISVTATGLNTNVFDILGLSLRYTPELGDSAPGRIYGQIGVADGRTIDTTFDLSLGLRF